MVENMRTFQARRSFRKRSIRSKPYKVDLNRDQGGDPGCQICAISARGKCASAVLTTSSSFKIQGRAASALRRRASIKPDMEAEEFINLLHGSDPVRVELSRLENELSETEMENCLGAKAEIKALRLSEGAREKAIEEWRPDG
ncbi:hypothetical protein OPV22_024048 [Ensete ventricosum]|uniref:Uncharacterized protein n=1 Tax=Ensete ventricosum TaxID=4639 RepID=A0AAV8QU83_ENSVE|nr:hypothetical protein OPV22_024044 [Ensete ventricosum]KAJ8480321.1 hypothetical protein OPV22_024048 [Ensete ventricosum]